MWKQTGRQPAPRAQAWWLTHLCGWWFHAENQILSPTIQGGGQVWQRMKTFIVRVVKGLLDVDQGCILLCRVKQDSCEGQSYTCWVYIDMQWHSEIRWMVGVGLAPRRVTLDPHATSYPVTVTRAGGIVPKSFTKLPVLAGRTGGGDKGDLSTIFILMLLPSHICLLAFFSLALYPSCSS